MSKCFEEECSQISVFSCICSDNEYCQRHLNKHIRNSQEGHQKARVKIDEGNKEFIVKALDDLRYRISLKLKRVQEETEKKIECLLKVANQLQEKFDEFLKEIVYIDSSLQEVTRYFNDFGTFKKYKKIKEKKVLIELLKANKSPNFRSRVAMIKKQILQNIANLEQIDLSDLLNNFKLNANFIETISLDSEISSIRSSKESLSYYFPESMSLGPISIGSEENSIFIHPKEINEEVKISKKIECDRFLFDLVVDGQIANIAQAKFANVEILQNTGVFTIQGADQGEVEEAYSFLKEEIRKIEEKTEMIH